MTVRQLSLLKTNLQRVRDFQNSAPLRAAQQADKLRQAWGSK